MYIGSVWNVPDVPDEVDAVQAVAEPRAFLVATPAMTSSLACVVVAVVLTVAGEALPCVFVPPASVGAVTFKPVK